MAKESFSLQVDVVGGRKENSLYVHFISVIFIFYKVKKNTQIWFETDGRPTPRASTAVIAELAFVVSSSPMFM